MTGVVVVGGGHAGIAAAFEIRERGYTGPLTVVDRGQYFPYERPPMSKTWVNDTTVPADLALHPRAVYETAEIDVVLGSEALHIDRERKEIHTDRGPLEYSELVLALGASPRAVSTMSGNAYEGVQNLHTLEDAVALRERFDKARRIVVVGGGFIGLEVASAAAKRGLSVAVIEMTDRVMSRTTSEPTAAYLQGRHEALDVTFRFNARVEEIGGRNGQVSHVYLSDGSVLDADLVLLGVGVAPNGRWVSKIGLKFDDGILVDRMLRTNDPNIYAIGDCARFEDDEGLQARLESVGNAIDHSRRVAAAIVDSSVLSPQVPWFWTVQAGVRLQMAGRIDQVEEWLMTGDAGSGKFSVLGWRGDRLMYGESVDSPGEHVLIRRLLSEGTAPALSDLRPVAGLGLKVAMKASA